MDITVHSPEVTIPLEGRHTDRMKSLVLVRGVILLIVLVSLVDAAPARRRRAHVRHRAATAHRTAGAVAGKRTFAATAYSRRGRTASGKITTAGRTVAADPKVLPPGSHIQVSNAGVYSGVYSVQDKGSAVKGRKIDLYVPQQAAARKFGRKQVQVEVLSKGETPAAN